MHATLSREPRSPIVPPGGVEVYARDMTVAVAADVTLAALDDALAPHAQWLPADARRDLPIGSLVLGNATGPLRLGYAAWRDLLLGAQFRDGRDRLLTAGGRAVKNVAGYDLTKFLVGSFGCFGAAVTFTLRTYRRPAGAVVATLPPDPALLPPLLTTPLRPHAALLTRAALRLRYFGDDRTLAWFERELAPRSLERVPLDHDVADRAHAWRFATDPGTFRLMLPPTQLPRALAALRDDDWAADPAFGIVVGADDPSLPLESLVRELGGSVLRFDADAKPLACTLPPEAAALLRRLKRAFDPDDRLPPLPVTTA
jgi:glycolate oxidase FAD binding subunit